MIDLRPLDLSYRTAYAQAKELALAQGAVPLVTAGSIHVEPRKGGLYVYRYRYGATGKRDVEYLGPEGAEETLLKVEQAQQEIADNALIAGYARDLRRLGLYSVDNSTMATIAALYNAGIFGRGGGRGALLVGTHAFGALLNELGVLGSPFPMTEDIDVARAHRIEVAALPKGGLLDVLRQTGLPFHEVPGLRRKEPATSYKARGTKLKVDLLVPSDERPFQAIAVPELKAYATGLPHLRYLLEGGSLSVLIGRERMVPVMVPHPGRFCLHKLAVYSLRSGGDNPKRDKDAHQAAMLCAALTRESEWLLDEAAEALHRTLRARVRPGAKRAAQLLGTRFPEAEERMTKLAE